MKTNWEPFGTRLRLWFHRGVSALMRARLIGAPKKIARYGDALAVYRKGMLKTLSQPMQTFVLVSSRRLDPDDAEHGTWNLVFEGRGRPSYVPGDMAYLSWRNSPETVREILALYGESGDREIVTTASSSIYIPGRYEPMSLKQALSRRIDLHECSAQTLKNAGLGAFVRHNRQQDKAHRQFHKDTEKEGGLVVTHPHFDYRQVSLPALLRSMNGGRPTLPRLMRSQNRISARPYTMSAFEQREGDRFRFEITVSQVEKSLYVSASEQQTAPARGAHFLSNLKSGDEVEGWLLPEVHRFPSTLGREVPVIVLCTGSGIGGLLSLLKTGTRGEVKSGPIWLIYGVRSWTKKHLYGPELLSYLRSGALARLDVANSRPLEGEGPARRVQDFLWDHRIEVAEQIRRGAHFYLSGRFSMGTEAVQTLERILVDQGIAADQPAARQTLIDWTIQLRLQASVSGV